MEKRKRRVFSSVVLTMACVSLLALAPVQGWAEDHHEDQFRQTAAMMLMMCMNTGDEQYQELQEVRSDKLNYLLLQNDIPCDAEDYIAILTSWREGQEECGEYRSTEDVQTLVESFEFKERSHEIQLTGEMEFADRSADVTFMFEEDGTVTAISVSGHYETNEIVRKAALNTVIGMGVVFCVLIFMSLIISGFGLINKVQKRLSDKEDKPEPKIKRNQITSVSSADPGEVDDETMAVITAVIEKEIYKNQFRWRENSLMRTYNVTLNGKTYQVEVEEVGAGKSHIRPASAPVQAAPAPARAAAPVQAAPVQTVPTQTAASAKAAAPAQTAAPAKAAAPAQTAAPVQTAPASGAGGISITAGVTGKVFKIEAGAGDTVKAGDAVVILEAMKMEIPVVAPVDGTITSMDVAVGDAVDAGQVLASIN